MTTFLTVLLYCVYLTNNQTMFILLLFIIHRLVIHGGLRADGELFQVLEHHQQGE